MHALMVVTLLAAAPAPTAPSLAVPDFRGTGVTPQLLGIYAEHIANQLAQTGVTVVSSRQIATLLGQQRQKELQGGCTENSEDCLAELSNALGSDFTMVGDVSSVDEGFKVATAVVAKNGQRVGSYSETVSNEPGVFRALSRAGWRLGSVLLARSGQLPTGLAPEAVVLGDPPPLRRVFWLPLAFGAVSMVAGGILAARAWDDYAQLFPRNPISLVEAERLRSDGKLFFPIGVTALAVGAAALASSVVMYFVGGGQPRNVQVAFGLSSSGGMLALEGRWW